MADPSPTAFISHASADRSRFVTDFAARLRASGIDAWYAEWEIGPGDSLVDRLFEDGVGNADAVIVVISEASVASKWVREEINAGFVRRVAGNCKLIPVVLDGVEVPEALRSTVWQTIQDTGSYDDEYDAIVRSIFDYSTRPPIGAPPAYTSTAVAIDGLPADTATVLGLLVDLAIAEADVLLGPLDTQAEQAAELGIDLAGFLEALEELEHDGYITFDMLTEERVLHSEISWTGLLDYLKASDLDVDAVMDRTTAHLVNADDLDFDALVAAVGQPRLIVEVMLEVLSSQDFIEFDRYAGGYLTIHRVSPVLKKYL